MAAFFKFPLSVFISRGETRTKTDKTNVFRKVSVYVTKTFQNLKTFYVTKKKYVAEAGVDLSTEVEHP